MLPCAAGLAGDCSMGIDPELSRALRLCLHAQPICHGLHVALTNDNTWPALPRGGFVHVVSVSECIQAHGRSVCAMQRTMHRIMLCAIARQSERNCSRLPCPSCSAGAAEGAEHRHMECPDCWRRLQVCLLVRPGTRESLGSSRSDPESERRLEDLSDGHDIHGPDGRKTARQSVRG
jgi:hypothetical protein